jgi:Lrp/AsnC family leucine-responsive transcriptional regulator
MQCYHVTGNADFILVILAKDIQDYDALARRLFIENPSVKRYQTSIVVNTVKLETMIPLIQESANQ